MIKTEKIGSITVDSSVFEMATKRVISFASTNNQVPLLCGINFRLDEEAIEWSATNGKSFSAVRILTPVKFDEPFDFSFTFPLKEIKQMRKEARKVKTFDLSFRENSLGGDEYKYNVAIASFPHSIKIAKDLQFINSQNMEFPSVKNFINKAFTGTFDILSLLNLIEDSEDQIIRCRVENNLLSIGFESIEIDCNTHEKLEFCFDKNLVIQSLESLLGEKAVLIKGLGIDAPLCWSDTDKFLFQKGMGVVVLVAPVLAKKK